jgi:HSP20 family protein
MYRSLFSRDVFANLDNFQRDLQEAFAGSAGILGLPRSATSNGVAPALNVGTTPESVEVYCFVPGVDPNSIDVNIEQGILTIAGERKRNPPAQDNKTGIHLEERFAGKFRRVVALPEDADADAVQASYRNGVLQVSVQRRKAPEPRRITIQ